MRDVKKLFGIGAVAAVVGLSGCAPGFLGPAGFRFDGSCSPMQRQAHMTSRYYAARQEIAATQARYQAGLRFARPTSESWKGIARGECRY